MFYNAKCLFIAVNASLRWLKNVSRLFLSLLLLVEYNCSMIKASLFAFKIWRIGLMLVLH
jgi:hypothetical protein